MELIELNRSIEEAKTNYELAKTEEEAVKYKSLLLELRAEKRKLLNEEFKRS